ncbi:hypothetical protein [Paraflavitalea speifideaquila]|uniref:hypothetical protein n=1 Tax=Paraflavitalea speifideaquila TaxID=3076558 RepID=UPI0028E62247|nr:hypothetical protein [Paraflavitalea speifideiaquila]
MQQFTLLNNNPQTGESGKAPLVNNISTHLPLQVVKNNYWYRNYNQQWLHLY